MIRHRTHQIDELAQGILRGSLPPTWVINRQECDYAKDFLIEIGNDDGELTGSSFFIQLKGQDKVSMSSFGSVVRFSLESKYASYYFDKIKDLPVFLVVVDVNQKRGWWIFLQPVLDADQAWRKKKSFTVKVPIVNDIADTSALRAAVIEAKRWMRLHHPESIHDAVVAHKEHITRADPRFDVSVSLVDDKPQFNLLAKEEVKLRLTVSGGDQANRFSELIDRGGTITFRPGDVTVSGSTLFKRMETEECTFQAGIKLAGVVTLTCWDSTGKELARLSDVPGHFTGGQKEVSFDGGLSNSPLALNVGPIAEQKGGAVNFDFSFHRWNGQTLLHLAYFDRLQQFFHTLPNAVSTTVECQIDGNTFFSVPMSFQSEPLFAVASFLDAIAKARGIAKKFNLNPILTTQRIDKDMIETIEELHAILFETGWSCPCPNVRFTAECIRETFRFDLVNKVTGPSNTRLTSEEVEYEFFGEKLKIKAVTNEFTEMSIRILDDKRSKPEKGKKARKRKTIETKAVDDDIFQIELFGTRQTVRRVWTGDHDLTEQTVVTPHRLDLADRDA